MKTMGRPIVNRTPKAMERDIAVLRRLRRSIHKDKTLDRNHAQGALDALDATIEKLGVLSTQLMFTAQS